MIKDKVLIEWNKDFSVGCPDIDKQHQRLIELINKFYQTFVQGKAHYLINEVLQEMYNYAQYHFKSEERLMQFWKFEGLDEHKKEHKEFITKITEFIKKYEQQDWKLSFEIMDFLKYWLEHHILVVDKKYSYICKKIYNEN